MRTYHILARNPRTKRTVCSFRLPFVQPPRLIHQHDGNPVADRECQTRLAAHQFLRFGVILQRGLRLRTDQSLKHPAVEHACFGSFGHCMISSSLPPRRAYSISVTRVSRRVLNEGASRSACLSSGSKPKSIDNELISSSSSASFRLS